MEIINYKEFPNFNRDKIKLINKILKKKKNFKINLFGSPGIGKKYLVLKILSFFKKVIKIYFYDDLKILKKIDEKKILVFYNFEKFSEIKKYKIYKLIIEKKNLKIIFCGFEEIFLEEIGMYFYQINLNLEKEEFKKYFEKKFPNLKKKINLILESYYPNIFLTNKKIKDILIEKINLKKDIDIDTEVNIEIIKIIELAKKKNFEEALNNLKKIKKKFKFSFIFFLNWIIKNLFKLGINEKKQIKIIEKINENFKKIKEETNSPIIIELILLFGIEI